MSVSVCMHSELCERLSELGERLYVGIEFIEYYGWMHLFRILLNWDAKTPVILAM